MYDEDDNLIATVTYKVGNGLIQEGDKAEVGVTDGKTTVVAFKDSYEEKTEDKGSIKLTKSFDGANVTKEEAEGAITFEITTKIGNKTYYVDKDGNLTQDKTVLTLKDGFTYDEKTGTFSKTFDDLPIGKYTVKETNTEIEGYEFTGCTINGTEGTTAQITVEADKETAANIVDSYEESTTEDTSETTEDSSETTEDSSESTEDTSESTEDTSEDTTESTTEDTTEATTGDTTEATTGDTTEATTEATTEVTTGDTTEITTEATTEEELGNLIITVVEEETNRVVPGAEVEVKYPDGSTVTYTTDENGKITLTDVPAGGYSITVKKVPEGYVVTTGGTGIICTVTAGSTTEKEALIVTKTATDSTNTSENTAVKTDDPTQTTPFIFAMLVSIAGMIFFVGRKKKLNR